MLYIAVVHSELPNEHVSSLIHAAQQVRIQVGEGKVCDCPSKAFEQRAFSGTQPQHTDHRMIVGAWDQSQNI